MDLTVQGGQSPASYMESAADWPPLITRVPRKPKVAQFCAAPWPNFTPPLTMIGPDNREVFTHTARLDEDQAQLMRAYGKRAPDTGWVSGDYRGYVQLIRGNTILAVRHADVRVR